MTLMRKSALLRCTCLIALLVALLFQAAQAQGNHLEHQEKGNDWQKCNDNFL